MRLCSFEMVFLFKSIWLTMFRLEMHMHECMKVAKSNTNGKQAAGIWRMKHDSLSFEYLFNLLTRPNKARKDRLFHRYNETIISFCHLSKDKPFLVQWKSHFLNAILNWVRSTITANDLGNTITFNMTAHLSFENSQLIDSSVELVEYINFY